MKSVFALLFVFAVLGGGMCARLRRDASSESADSAADSASSAGAGSSESAEDVAAPGVPPSGLEVAIKFMNAKLEKQKADAAAAGDDASADSKADKLEFAIEFLKNVDAVNKAGQTPPPEFADLAAGNPGGAPAAAPAAA